MVVGEKRITKTFQYDTPGELVMTYLSQVSTSLYGSLLTRTNSLGFALWLYRIGRMGFCLPRLGRCHVDTLVGLCIVTHTAS